MGQITSIRSNEKSGWENYGEDAVKGTVVSRFDVFKGYKDESGKVTKIKSLGSAYIREGLKTYTLHLKTFLKDTYYLLPNTKHISTNADFVILTREIAQNSGKKYFWNNIGEARAMKGPNAGLLELDFDLLGEDVYMPTEPYKVGEVQGGAPAWTASEAV